MQLKPILFLFSILFLTESCWSQRPYPRSRVTTKATTPSSPSPSDRQTPTKEKLNILDFGAIPNDQVNDQAAFEAAADYINKKGGNCELFIPAGTYIVGGQKTVKDKNWYLRGRDVLEIKNSRNVIIRGEKGSLLKYDMGFRYGSFDPATGLSSNNPFVKGRTVSSQRADLGRLIYINQSQNVEISNLVLEGNFYPENINNMNRFDIWCFNNKNAQFQKNKINLGGGYGDLQIQLLHTGIFVYYSGGVKINQVTARRFGLDGLMIVNRHDVATDKGVEVRNATFSYNGRTGIAITGGNGLLFEDCVIENTGQCMYTSTGTGIDIEAQKDPKHSKLVKNVTINRCVFDSNREGDLAAHLGLGSDNVLVENSSFTSTRRALRMGPRATNYTFKNNVFKGTNSFQGGKKVNKVNSELQLKQTIQNARFEGNIIK